MESEKTFDARIKALLENLEAAPRPASWDEFEQKLDSQAMDNSSTLDTLLASRLGSLEVAGQTPDWDVMQQMLEAEETAELIENEAAIDNLAYEKLAHLSAPYRASHWELMARRLQEEYSLRHQLYRYKAAEISLMLLLLITIIRFLPYAADLYGRKDQAPQPQKTELRPAVIAPLQNAGTAPVQAELEEGSEPQAATWDARVPASPVSPLASTPKGEPGSKHQIPSSKSSADALPPAFGESQALLNRQDNNQPSPLSLPPLSEIPIRTGEGQMQEQLLAKASHGKGVSAATEQSMIGKAEFLDLLDAQFIDTKSAKALPLLTAMPLPKKTEIRFSLFASTDFNYVFTPATRLNLIDTLVRVDNDTAFALGYGGGILASFKTNRWELQTGGVYSFRRYSPGYPKFTIETVGYYISEDFKGIQQDLLQVPLNLQYYFKNRGNWRFYGTAGASGYFITSVVYEIAVKRQPSFDPISGPDETRTVFQEKEFPKGLFDGGSLEDNFYLTANLGLGVERYITPRWSLFFQPNYHHYLLSDGVGTNKDKFYTLSFYLGTKVGLK
ncbi:MAG: hypothetical protein R2830_09840 [Saprospiraceae bacterium]